MFSSYVEGALPLLGGEPVGKMGWTYDGEAFVDGVFEVTCPACKAKAFHADACPLCQAPDKLESALTTENAFPVPLACPRCEGEEVRLRAFVPVKVVYERGRPAPARTTVEILDPGFHAHRVDCKPCGVVAKLGGRCAVCGSDN